jgi:cytochrome c551/c552
MKIKQATLLLLMTSVFSLKLFADASIDDGKTIFTSRCTSCHNVNAQVVGPALANVDQRHPVEWIVNFVHSPKTMIAKNDKDAVALYNRFNQIVMPDHSDLSSDDIKSILAYIKSETKVVSTEAPFAKPGILVPNYHPLSVQDNYGFFITYLAGVAAFVLLLIFAVNVKDVQRKNSSVKEI